MKAENNINEERILLVSDDNNLVHRKDVMEL